jgi:threonine/homoserine/homoserine lactone efflux protein
MSFLAELMGGFFAILKWIGGGYLIWLGWQLWRQPPSAELRPAEARRGSLAASFAAGFLLTLGDAKAILFYASLFPALFTPGQLEAGALCLIVLTTVVAVGGVKLLYAIAAQHIVRRVQNPRLRQTFRKTAGGFLMGLGGYVVVRA